jgi:hypothetical protein
LHLDGHQLFSVYHSIAHQLDVNFIQSATSQMQIASDGSQTDANLAATLMKCGCRLATCQLVFITQLTASRMKITQK